MLGWFVVLAGALTWPMLRHPATEALGSARGDGIKHLWTLWWMRASVWNEGQLPFHTTLINWPVGMDLYPIEPLNGLFGVLAPWMNVVLLSNLLIFGNLVATGMAGAWFGRELSGNDGGGFVAGTMLMGSSVMACFVHLGAAELTHIWWLPLGFGTLIRARKGTSWMPFLALSGCLVGATLSCFYLGMFLAMGTLVWSISTLWAGRRTPILLVQYAVAAGLGLCVVVPVATVFSGSYELGSVPDVSFMSYLSGEHGQPITDPTTARLELSQLWTPGREAANWQESAYGAGRYVGVVALLLAAWGLIRRPRQGIPWLLVAAVGLVFAQGSYLTMGGEEVLVGGRKLQMPLVWLNRAMGYLAEPLNFPVRFQALTVTALAGLASLAVRGPWSLLGLLVVLEVSWGQMLDRPWETLEPQEASALRVVRDHEGHAMVDLALAWRSDAENRWSALSTQIEHEHPVQAVPVERIEYFAMDGQHFVRALPLLDDLEPLYNRSRGGLSGDYRSDLALLRDAGFHELLINYRGGRETLPLPLVQAMDRLCGPALVRTGFLGLWPIPEVEYTEEEMTTWRETHQARVNQVMRLTPGMGPQVWQ
ncbi:MAG: hypothetical protein QGG40_03130 [Myxococcota bacterium]|jgi:hypothetical protein|nr:hypothetical protein [Myxococcota bacterium]